MNGNRWVGTGHNTVFEDEAGQWWTIYHAVDREDPFFTTTLANPTDRGFTKRPALLDPVDWIGGWPTVNGGAFASDTEMAAPAAQEGQRSRYRTRVVRPHVLGRQLVSDGFSGNRLIPSWSWVREEAADYSVAGGVLRFEIQQRDLFVDSNNASVLVRDAPRATTSSRRRSRSRCPTAAASTSPRPAWSSTTTTTTSSSCRTPRSGRRARRSSPRSSVRCSPASAGTATPSSVLRLRTGPPTCGSSSSG
jgi:arabinan endo-1,5-alpha-L-arabinosidase